MSKIFFVNVWRKSVFEIYFRSYNTSGDSWLLMDMVHDRCYTLLTGLSTALTTTLPILFQYCYKCWYSDRRNLCTVMKAGGLAPQYLVQPTISLEMPVPSQGHYGFPSLPVVDWFCLLIYLWVLTFPLEVCSEFDNFVITPIENLETTFAKMVKSVKRTHSIELQRETKKLKLAKKKNSKQLFSESNIRVKLENKITVCFKIKEKIS